MRLSTVGSDELVVDAGTQARRFWTVGAASGIVTSIFGSINYFSIGPI